MTTVLALKYKMSGWYDDDECDDFEAAALTLTLTWTSTSASVRWGRGRPTDTRWTHDGRTRDESPMMVALNAIFRRCQQGSTADGARNQKGEAKSRVPASVRASCYWNNEFLVMRIDLSIDDLLFSVLFSSFFPFSFSVSERRETSCDLFRASVIRASLIPLLSYWERSFYKTRLINRRCVELSQLLMCPRGSWIFVGFVQKRTDGLLID